MMSLIRSVACVCALALVACSNSPEVKSRKLPLLAKTDCELVYKSGRAQVVENFCETEWKPITVNIRDQEYSVDWIDEETSRHLFEHGCGKTGACYYELTLDGVTVNGRFSYVSNVVKGEYLFEIDANENSKLLNETSTDLPS